MIKKQILNFNSSILTLLHADYDVNGKDVLLKNLVIIPFI